MTNTQAQYILVLTSGHPIQMHSLEAVKKALEDSTRAGYAIDISTGEYITKGE